MPLPYSSNKLITALALGIPVALTVQRLITYYRQISLIPPTPIRSANTVPPALLVSATVRQHVNPRGRITMQDSRYIDLESPPKALMPSDEALLGHFVQGFFDGKVIALERAALRCLNRRLTMFSSIKTDSPPDNIWSTGDLSPLHLPPLHSIILGTYQVADISLRMQSDPKSPPSHIDFIYGNGDGQFAGVHRFSLSHPKVDHRTTGEESIADGDDVLRIHYASLNRFSTFAKAIKADSLLHAFHNAYAMLLFREGAERVKQAMHL